MPHVVERLGLCTTATEPELWSPRAAAAEARASGARAWRRERPPRWKARAPQRGGIPTHLNYRKTHSDGDPMQPKINKFIKKKKKGKSELFLNTYPHILSLSHTHTHILTAGPSQRMFLLIHKDSSSLLIVSVLTHIFYFYSREKFSSSPKPHGSEHNPVFRLCFKDNSKNNWYFFNGYCVPDTVLRTSWFCSYFFPRAGIVIIIPLSKWGNQVQSKELAQSFIANMAKQNLIQRSLILSLPYIAYNLYFYTFLLWCS